MEIFEFVPEGTENCRVAAWLHGNDERLMQRKRPAVVICPGGAYQDISCREAEPAAERFFAAGYNTFILYYSVGDQAQNFTPLIQLAAAVRQIRANGNQWNTDPSKIAVCGFSAGGHLACSLGTLYNTGEFRKAFGLECDVRPDAMILCYPVIVSNQYANVLSLESVSGAEKGSEKYGWFGLDVHVHENTPPTFLWHTAADTGVPVENSLQFALALSAKKIPFELHVFPYGEHGMSVCTNQVDTFCEYNARWVEMSIQWLNLQFGFTL